MHQNYINNDIKKKFISAWKTFLNFLFGYFVLFLKFLFLFILQYFSFIILSFLTTIISYFYVDPYFITLFFRV